MIYNLWNCDTLVMRFDRSVDDEEIEAIKAELTEKTNLDMIFLPYDACIPAVQRDLSPISKGAATDPVFYSNEADRDTIIFSFANDTPPDEVEKVKKHAQSVLKGKMIFLPPCLTLEAAWRDYPRRKRERDGAA